MTEKYLKVTRLAVKERFWSKVNKNGPNGCWLWMGTMNSNGYGIFSINQKHNAAHRISYELNRGQIPKGICVLHHCDNPLCVNPSHLFLGDKGDNLRDAYSKGRFKNPNGLGEASSRHKLTLDQAIAIRRVRGWYPTSLLGKEFGVGKSTVQHIWDGDTWRSYK